MRKLMFGLFIASITCTSFSQSVSPPAFVTPYCAVGDKNMSTFPGVNAYVSDGEGHALRKPDGGLKAVSVERGIGCQVTLRQVEGKLLAHVIARRVSVEPLLFDSEKILLQEPKPKVDLWEREVDVTAVDRVEFSEKDVAVRMNVVVGVLRSE